MLSLVSPGGTRRRTNRGRPQPAPDPLSSPARDRQLPATGRGYIRQETRTLQDIHNGISAAQLEGAIWRKSQRSNSQGACVELARLDPATVAMRNSRDPKGTALIYPATAVRAMVSALRSGEFDYLIG